MQIAIVAGSTRDITNYLINVSWSGSRLQAARTLKFNFSTIDEVAIDCGYTVVAGDDNGDIVFRGNIYDLEKDRAKNQISCTAYDNLFVLSKSKTTRKFDKALPEDVARGVCAELGVKAGNIASTGCYVTFIANGKTGYQIIQGAYTEAKKQNGKMYMCVMRGDLLDIVEKGTLCGAVLDSRVNMTDSVYKESIENLVNAVLVTDTEGNRGELVTDADSINKYSYFQEVYKQQKDKDALKEARAMINKPERLGNVTALGDYRARAGYSLIVRDANFNGQFWIRSDTHTFKSGLHTMKLELEYENLMTEEKVQ